MNWKITLTLPTALILGLLIGWADYKNNDIQTAAIMLIFCGFPLGFILPRRWWLWAIALGIGVPAFYLGARILGHPDPYPLNPGIFILPFIPAFLSVYAGVFFSNQIKKNLLSDRAKKKRH